MVSEIVQNLLGKRCGRRFFLIFGVVAGEEGDSSVSEKSKALNPAPNRDTGVAGVRGVLGADGNSVSKFRV